MCFPFLIKFSNSCSYPRYPRKQNRIEMYWKISRESRNAEQRNLILLNYETSEIFIWDILSIPISLKTMKKHLHCNWSVKYMSRLQKFIITSTHNDWLFTASARLCSNYFQFRQSLIMHNSKFAGFSYVLFLCMQRLAIFVRYQNKFREHGYSKSKAWMNFILGMLLNEEWVQKCYIILCRV